MIDVKNETFKHKSLKSNPEESKSESNVEMYSPSYYKQMKHNYSMCAKIHMTQYKENDYN